MLAAPHPWPSATACRQAAEVLKRGHADRASLSPQSMVYGGAQGDYAELSGTNRLGRAGSEWRWCQALVAPVVQEPIALVRHPVTG